MTDETTMTREECEQERERLAVMLQRHPRFSKFTLGRGHIVSLSRALRSALVREATLEARCEALRGHADALCDDVCANWCVDPKKCKMDVVSPGCAYRTFIDDTTTDTGEGA